MKNCWFFCVVLQSPSSRAEWVEIEIIYHQDLDSGSPSSRVEWVEMDLIRRGSEVIIVSVLVGGVG